MVSREDLGLLIGGVIAASAVASFVLPAITKGKGPPPPGQTYTVTVKVTDVTALPVAGASVTLGASLPLVTDASGTAVFTGFAPGSYTMTVIATGFQTVTQLVQVFSDSLFSATLSPTTTCLPQPCPPGYSWSSLPPCGCVPQKIASLSVPPVFRFDKSWTLIRQGYWYNPFPTVCGYATPGNPSSCPPLVSCLPGQSSCSPCCGQGGFGSDTAQVLITAVVKDVNGNPVAGVPVSAGFTGYTTIPWNAVFFAGIFDASLIYSTLTTDNLGTVFFVVNIKLSGVQSKQPDPTQGGPYPGNVQIPLGLLLTVVGTPIIAPVSITMNANLCAYYPTCGAFPL